MATLKVEFELNDTEQEFFDAYIDAHCLDREKFLARTVYNSLNNTVGKWNRRNGVPAVAFGASKDSASPGLSNKGRYKLVKN